MSLSTHVLDLASGLPVPRLPVRLERRDGEGWRELGRARTDDDGRVRALLPEGAPLEEAVYRLTFDVEAHHGPGAFHPEVSVVFRVLDAARHHHVPLLLSPFGYSTYRGS
ncbi:MAG: hydroxyisourate hydrolase [Myxococcales bacterium]|nr:hydroxyisourate hydrolase [Myxococcales bacterium]